MNYRERKELRKKAARMMAVLHERKTVKVAWKAMLLIEEYGMPANIAKRLAHPRINVAHAAIKQFEKYQVFALKGFDQSDIHRFTTKWIM